jgi:hypothetical protein
MPCLEHIFGMCAHKKKKTCIRRSFSLSYFRFLVFFFAAFLAVFLAAFFAFFFVAIVV